jgi:hypothetical protein
MEKLWTRFFYYLSFAYYLGVISLTVISVIFLIVVAVYPGLFDSLVWFAENYSNVGWFLFILIPVGGWLAFQFIIYNIFHPT